MARHKIDHPKDARRERLVHFLRIEREQLPGERSRTLMLRLQRRAHQRLRAFTRIARGQSV